MRTVKWLGLACIAVSLTACDDGSDDSPTYTPPAVPDAAAVGTQTGYVIDSAVANIDYQTPSHQGVTGADGSFQYEPGESVTLSIGDLVLGTVPAQATITPFELTATPLNQAHLYPEAEGGAVKTWADLSGDEQAAYLAAINMARLLQTLDQDADADNGLAITDTARNGAAQGQAFDVDLATFETQVNTLILNGGQDAAPAGLVTADAAWSHLQGSLACTGERVYQVSGYEVLAQRDSLDPDRLELTSLSGELMVADVAPDDRFVNVLRDCDLYVGDDYTFGRAVCEVVDSRLHALNVDDVTIKGTVAANSATFYIYDGKVSADYEPTDGTQNEVTDVPHALLTASSESVCALASVPYGVYELEGLEAVFDNGGKNAKWSSATFDGDLTFSADGCTIRSEAGIWDCQVVGNRLFGLGDASAMRGTITAESVTLLLPYSRDGDDYRYGYAQGRPAN